MQPTPNRANLRAQRALRGLVLYVPYVLTHPTCLTCPHTLRALRVHMPKYILQTRKLKISVSMKSNVGSFTDVFKGAEFLKFLFIKSVPKILNFSMLRFKTTLINIEGQNNTYKC